ncbi:MAG: zinc ABC transporter substrate-binding protein [Rhodospirillales bacterium]
MPQPYTARRRTAVKAAVLLSAVLWTPAPASAEAPTVVASIKPLHSLIVGVMTGIGSPSVLIAGGASPHAYSLRPSEARLLSRADLIFWVGDSMETFLQKPLHSLGRKAIVVKLSGTPGIRLLKSREGGPWDAHVDDEAPGHGHDKTQTEQAHGVYDMHIWLGRDNAKAIVRTAVTALSKKDPPNAARYRKNGQGVIARIDSTFRAIDTQLAPVRSTPYFVFHDAYQYFERDHRLNAAGSISTHEARKPGAKRLSEIRAKLLSHGIRCVFAEPQFEPALVKTIIGGTPAKSGVLDPLGAKLAAGPDMYFLLLNGLAKNLKDCLTNAS